MFYFQRTFSAKEALTPGISESVIEPSEVCEALVWRYNEFGDQLRDIENRKLCDHMKK
jgi:hypothetical protein